MMEIKIVRGGRNKKEIATALLFLGINALTLLQSCGSPESLLGCESQDLPQDHRHAQELAKASYGPFSLRFGKTVMFNQAGGQWNAEVQDVWGGTATLPVVCKGDAAVILSDLQGSRAVDVASRIHLLDPDQAPKCVHVGALGVRGGGRKNKKKGQGNPAATFSQAVANSRRDIILPAVPGSGDQEVIMGVANQHAIARHANGEGNLSAVANSAQGKETIQIDDREYVLHSSGSKVTINEEAYTLIRSAKEFMHIGNSISDNTMPMDGNYVISTTLDFKGVKNFRPIGTKCNPFRGKLNAANGAKIKGLKITSKPSIRNRDKDKDTEASSYEGFGLLGSIVSAHIENITIEDFEIDIDNSSIDKDFQDYCDCIEYDSIGALVGCALRGEDAREGSSIIRCNLRNGSIRYKCRKQEAMADESDRSSPQSYYPPVRIGGLVGHLPKGSNIDQCSTANVSIATVNPSMVGGLAGEVEEAEISNVIIENNAIKSIAAQSSIGLLGDDRIFHIFGGIVGLLQDSTLSNAKSFSGRIAIPAGSGFAGGIVGEAVNGSRIEDVSVGKSQHLGIEDLLPQDNTPGFHLTINNGSDHNVAGGVAGRVIGVRMHRIKAADVLIEAAKSKNLGGISGLIEGTYLEDASVTDLTIKHKCGNSGGVTGCIASLKDSNSSLVRASVQRVRIENDVDNADRIKAVSEAILRLRSDQEMNLSEEAQSIHKIGGIAGLAVGGDGNMISISRARVSDVKILYGKEAVESSLVSKRAPGNPKKKRARARGQRLTQKKVPKTETPTLATKTDVVLGDNEALEALEIAKYTNLGGLVGCMHGGILGRGALDFEQISGVTIVSENCVLAGGLVGFLFAGFHCEQSPWASEVLGSQEEYGMHQISIDVGSSCIIGGIAGCCQGAYEAYIPVSTNGGNPENLSKDLALRNIMLTDASLTAKYNSVVGGVSGVLRRCKAEGIIAKKLFIDIGGNSICGVLGDVCDHAHATGIRGADVTFKMIEPATNGNATMGDALAGIIHDNALVENSLVENVSLNGVNILDKAITH